MKTRRTRAVALPDRLERARERFEGWRETRERRAIPEALWVLAVKLAGEYGNHRTAGALRLNSESLKKRVDSTGQSKRPGMKSGPTFVELVPNIVEGVPEYVVELEDAQGASMRIQCKGGAGPDVAALTRSFWSGAP